jgi:phosphoglucosamine mutase
LINVAVKRKPDLSSIPEIAEAIETVEADLGDEGRVLVRYSGTENLCRVMVEGPTEALTEKHCTQIAETVRNALG